MFLVDEVEGVLCFGVFDWVLVFVMVGCVSVGLLCGVLVWCGKLVGLFDDDCLFDVVIWSM